MNGDNFAWLFALAAAAFFWWLAYKVIITREGRRSVLNEWRESKIDCVLSVIVFLGALHFVSLLASYGRIPGGLFGLGISCAALIARGAVQWIKTGRLP